MRRVAALWILPSGQFNGAVHTWSQNADAVTSLDLHTGLAAHVDPPAIWM